MCFVLSVRCLATDCQASHQSSVKQHKASVKRHKASVKHIPSICQASTYQASVKQPASICQASTKQSSSICTCLTDAWWLLGTCLCCLTDAWGDAWQAVVKYLTLSTKHLSSAWRKLWCIVISNYKRWTYGPAAYIVWSNSWNLLDKGFHSFHSTKFEAHHLCKNITCVSII